MGREVAGLLVESYEARGLRSPPWVLELRRHYESRGHSASDVA